MAKHLIPGDSTLRAVRPGDPRKRISDGAGLYLLLFVKGGAHGWRFDYTFQGRRLTISFGTYPDTGLSLARQKGEEARKLIAAGTDPSEARKTDRAAQAQQREAQALADAGLPPQGSFQQVAEEWLSTVHEAKVSPGHADRTRTRLEQDAFPWFGRRPIGEIEAPEVLQALRRIEARGAIETAHRVKDACGQVFRYGVAIGRGGLYEPGLFTIQRKAKWPRWTPTPAMIAREPEIYAQYSEGMPPGPANALGARALYLYKGGRDTMLRIHGTPLPRSIGWRASSGCVRMVMAHIIGLYENVDIGVNAWLYPAEDSITAAT
jgi:hypothetical protein